MNVKHSQQFEDSYVRKETEKKNCFFEKLQIYRKKYMAFKLFEFQEQFIIDTFFIKSTQLQKTGSKGKFFIQLRNQNKKSQLESAILLNFSR